MPTPYFFSEARAFCCKQAERLHESADRLRQHDNHPQQSKVNQMYPDVPPSHLNLLMFQETQEVEGCKVDALVSVDCNSVAGRSATANTSLSPHLLTDTRGKHKSTLEKAASGAVERPGLLMFYPVTTSYLTQGCCLESRGATRGSGCHSSISSSFSCRTQGR